MGDVRATQLVRRMLAGLVAIGLAVVLTACSGSPPGRGTTTGTDGTGGEFGDAPSSSPEPGGTAHLVPLGISVLVEHKTLVRPDGISYALDSIPGGVGGGYQTRDGWLLNGGDGSLWLVTPTGVLRQLLDKIESGVGVAPDGRRIAWRSAGRLYYGHIDPATKAIVDRSSPAPERGAPIAVGTDSVILGYTTTGGGIDNHDVWFPGLGDYKPTWDKTTHVLALYAPGRTDGTYLGLVLGPGAGKDLCLAAMNPKTDLKPTKTACGIITQADNRGAVSPDGHWLAVLSSSPAGAGEIAVLDLTTVFTKPAVAIRWPSDRVGVWEDAANMLVTTSVGGGLIRYHLGSTAPDPVARAGVTGASRIALLPRLG